MNHLLKAQDGPSGATVIPTARYAVECHGDFEIVGGKVEDVAHSVLPDGEQIDQHVDSDTPAFSLRGISMGVRKGSVPICARLTPRIPGLHCGSGGYWQVGAPVWTLGGRDTVDGKNSFQWSSWVW